MMQDKGVEGRLAAGLGGGEGQLRLVQVSPPTVVAGRHVTLRLRFRAGDRGVVSGSTLLLELPPNWYTARQSYAKPVQSSAPDAPNHVVARRRRTADEAWSPAPCEVIGGTTQEVVLAARAGIDGRRRRYMYVTRVELAGGLPAGGEVEVVYGDVSGGSMGFATPRFSNGPEHPVAALDTPDGRTDVPIDASIEVLPDGPHELLAIAPSVVAPDTTGNLWVTTVDRHGNPCPLPPGPPLVRVLSGVATLDAPVPWEGRRSAGWSVSFRPASDAPLRIEVTHGSVRAVSNPVDCRADSSTEGIYWGDLHSHAQDSFDAIGAFPYEYAREVAALDFYALTEHCEYVDDAGWSRLVGEAARRHEPGRFVVFPAYEATFGEPWGHHNVFFRHPDAVVPPTGAHNGDLVGLWDAIRGPDAFTVPHHTGISFSSSVANEHDPSPNPDWSFHDQALRPTIEIYSAHGSSERFDPRDPLAYDNCDHSISTSREGPYYAWDAWHAGLEMGVIGSSDDHMGQPGRGEYGLAAVRARSLDRDPVFDALRSGIRWATTGARIILDLRVGGSVAGGHVAQAQTMAVAVRVLGTGPLERVEVLALDEGSPVADVVHSWDVDTWDLDAFWTDEHADRRRLWYVRVLQAAPYRGRPVMAWSSPVWVRRSPATGTADGQ
jgi:hypothetical protein